VDLVFLVAAVASGLLLQRSRAVLVTAAAWAICVAMVGWGPAGNSDVHTGSMGFWLPWAVVLVIGIALTIGTTALRSRRARQRSAAQL
jgi:F0F1-type ATP synthase assembly protein I